jgi:L-lactate dehydrogenase complex protein LldG
VERGAFLERVGRAVAGHRAVELPSRWPPPPGAGDGTADAERFAVALAATHGQARVIERRELPGAVADLAREMGRSRRVVVAPDVDRYRDDIEDGLLQAFADVVRPADPAQWREAAAAADMGITSAACGVVATGSVLIVPGPDCPRVASLLPSTHLVILPVARLVPGLEEAMAAVAAVAGTSSAPVLVTGPSRTSDIEMATVYGVHGPKELRVLLLRDEP